MSSSVTRSNHRLCKSLQGHVIPLFYASGTLDHPNCSTQRAVSTRINLLEYIQDAKTLHDADPASVAPTTVTSLIATVKSFDPLGVIHGDNKGNVLISSNQDDVGRIVRHSI